MFEIGRHMKLIHKQRRFEMTTSILSQSAVDQGRVGAKAADQTGQYTLWQILGIWALVSLPMGLLAWVVAPAIIPHIPLHPGITFWLLMIAGMGWQFVVSLVIIYRELGTLRWSAIRERVWLQTPRDPATDKPNPRLYWWLVVPLLWNALMGIVLMKYLDAPMALLFPGLTAPAFRDMSQLAGPQFRGQWWLLGIALLSLILNYFLGEEFLWHGVLLPKMRGVFGKYDWVANAVLFGLYHLQKPWEFVSTTVTNLGYGWPARRFRSNWMAIIVHAVEGLPLLVLVLAGVLGLVG